jgi:hypothetical protein
MTYEQKTTMSWQPGGRNISEIPHSTHEVTEDFLVSSFYFLLVTTRWNWFNAGLKLWGCYFDSFPDDVGMVDLDSGHNLPDYPDLPWSKGERLIMDKSLCICGVSFILKPFITPTKGGTPSIPRILQSWFNFLSASTHITHYHLLLYWLR